VKATVNTTRCTSPPNETILVRVYKPAGTSEDVFGVASLVVWRLTVDVEGFLVERLDEFSTAVCHVKVDEKHEH